jgi:hypothetical protein
MSVSDFASEPAVKGALKTLSADSSVDRGTRFLAGVMVKGAEADADGNLLADSSFEQSADHGWDTSFDIHGELSRSDDVAASGQYSLKCKINHHWFTAEKIISGTKPGVNYYFAARFYVPKDQQPNLEGRLEFWGNPAEDGKNRTWPANIPELRLTSGKWNYVSAVVPSHSGANSTCLRFRLKHFEKGAVVYVDDLQLFEIPTE